MNWLTETWMHRVLRLLIIIGLVILLMPLLRTFWGITVDDILAFRPENDGAAALVIIVLYALKSVMVFFPLLVLFISTGFIFTTGWALIINLLGCTVCFTIPYLIGTRVGPGYVRRITNRYPKAELLYTLNRTTPRFLSYLPRIVGLLPGDVVSLLLGSLKMLYPKYILGSLLGILPKLVLATLMGSAATQPSSPVFWGSLIAHILTTLLSVLGFAIFSQRTMPEIWQR